MNKVALLQQAKPGAAPASQATTIEQSRAIAQVQGALIVAQQRPRDAIMAANRMREACAVPALAQRAFFRYSRGGETVTGPTIQLATELARCWGNLDYGVVELARDDNKGESEMLAYTWDLETNTRNHTGFLVPHRRDTKNGAKALTDQRDIYENNANNAARRLRETIFHILPKYFVEEAKEICRETIESGGGIPLPERRENLLTAFAGIGITRKQVEKKIGVAADKLTALDIANLGIIFQSIKRGETTAADEFEDDTAAAITGDLKAAAQAAKAPPSSPPAPSPPQAGGDLLGVVDGAAPAAVAAPSVGEPEKAKTGTVADFIARFKEELAACRDNGSIAELQAREADNLNSLQQKAPRKYDELSGAIAERSMVIAEAGNA